MTKHLSDSLLLLLGPTTQLSTIVDTELYSPNSQAVDKLRQRPLVFKESILYFFERICQYYIISENLENG